VRMVLVSTFAVNQSRKRSSAQKAGEQLPDAGAQVVAHRCNSSERAAVVI
jgi:hypothetical protein